MEARKKEEGMEKDGAAEVSEGRSERRGEMGD